MILTSVGYQSLIIKNFVLFVNYHAGYLLEKSSVNLDESTGITSIVSHARSNIAIKQRI
jgi:hypothetical protein